MLIKYFDWIEGLCPSRLLTIPTIRSLIISVDFRQIGCRFAVVAGRWFESNRPRRKPKTYLSLVEGHMAEVAGSNPARRKPIAQVGSAPQKAPDKYRVADGRDCGPGQQ